MANCKTVVKQIHADNWFTGVRLPTDIRPVHYHLELKPNFDDLTFSGEVSILFTNESSTPTKVVVVHANELNITDGYVNPSPNMDESTQTSANRLVSVTYSKTSETATLEFQKSLVISGKINLVFNGKLNDRLRGFHQTSFKIGNTTVYTASTQFAPTDARLCFPCWDEPEIKATFTFAMIFNKYINVEGTKYERVVVSNTREISRAGTDSETRVEFERTPRMSTYLLAFSVGPFEYIEDSDKRRPIRVYATLGKKEHGRYALDVACKVLPFLEDYFGIGYPLSKMDLIALPDLSYSAMENWGLVTYKESCLLVDPKNSSTSVKQYVAVVVAHELSHQWFGNLVTMKWWTHLWLNEGFASFMETLCVDHVFPEYDIWTQFLTSQYNRAMVLDALHSSHPIEVPVNNPSEINEIFDAISYAKGASVIRMLYEYIGDASFRQGMKDYLTEFAYGNATTEDLWRCLENASNKPVQSLMSGWTSQKGFPSLEVKFSREGSKTRMVMSQGKFSADGKLSGDEASVTWMIPIKAITGSQPNEPKEICLLNDKSFECTCDQTNDTWLKLNPGTVGLYRVAYPEEMIKKILPAIERQTLSPMDRFGVINDFFALCQAGKRRTVDFLAMLQSFKGENAYTVWSSIDNCLSILSMLLASTDYRDKFYRFCCHLLSDIFKNVTWDEKEDERHTETLTRALVINRLVAFGDQSVIDEAKRRFRTSKDNLSSISADLRSSIYKAVAIYGDNSSFDDLFSIYNNNVSQEEKDRVATAIGHCRGNNRLDRVIEFALSDELRVQTRLNVLGPLGESNPSVGWKLLQDNREFFVQKYGSNFILSRLVKLLTQNFSSTQMVKEMERYFEQNKFPGAERAILQSIESVKSNAEWLARDGDAIKEFLNARGQN